MMLWPVFVEFELMYSMPCTPLICCSSGDVTACATVSASAPL